MEEAVAQPRHPQSPVGARGWAGRQQPGSGTKWPGPGGWAASPANPLLGTRVGDSGRGEGPHGGRVRPGQAHGVVLTGAPGGQSQEPL